MTQTQLQYTGITADTLAPRFRASTKERGPRYYLRGCSLDARYGILDLDQDGDTLYSASSLYDSFSIFARFQKKNCLHLPVAIFPQLGHFGYLS